MQRFNDEKGKNGKAHVQHQRRMVAFFDALRWGLPAPRFWETYGETALPMDTKINEKTFSTLIVAVYPASACVPKGFTTACTIIIPMDTVDCCKTDGTAMRSMEYSSCRSNLLKGLFILLHPCKENQKRKHSGNSLCNQGCNSRTEHTET